MKKMVTTFLHNVRHSPESMDSAKELVKDVADIIHTNARSNTKLHKFVRNATTAYSTGLMVHSAINLVRDLMTENIQLPTIEIVETDMLFNVVTGLMNTTTDENKGVKQLAVELRSRTLDRYATTKQELNIYKDHLIGGDIIRFDQDKAFVYAVPSANNEKTLTIAGHKVHVLIKKPEKMMMLGGYTNDKESNTVAPVSKKVSQTTAIITCPNEKASKEIQEYLRNNLQIIGKRKVTLYKAQSWGSFIGSSDMPERPISTVVLKKGQIESVIEELNSFIESEDKYNILGIPYHHGILLSGPPGTGKSSTAKVVASHLGLDTYYIALSSVRDNETFHELISEIKPRSVLLLEDIDTVQAAKSRDKKGKDGVTMDALLNVLDGVLSPHGVITIATTNHVENLDEAVIRPGRIDTVYAVDYLDNEQLERICKQFIKMENVIFPDITGLKISPADIVGEIKKHINDHETAYKAIDKFIAKRIRKHQKRKDKNDIGRVGSEVSGQNESAVHNECEKTTTT